MKVLAMLATGFEDLEAMGTIALLRRAQIEVVLCSIENTPNVSGRYGLNVSVDINVNYLNLSEYDLLFLPGGMPGVENLLKSPKIKEIIEHFINENKKIAAICAAPAILGSLGFIKDKSFTCYPGFEKFCSDGKHENVSVCVCGNLITARAAGSVIDFALTVIAELKGEEVSNKVQTSIFYN